MYIGPYIQILKHKTIETLHTYRVCLNKSCEDFDKGLGYKFCCKCGSEIGSIERLDTQNIGVYSLLSEKFERYHDLYEPNYKNDMLLANIISPFDVAFNDDMLDLSTLDMISPVEWMKKEFKEQIDYLRQKLGDENVTVQYGVMEFY